MKYPFSKGNLFKMAGEFSIHTGVKKTLGVVDYVMFVLMFVASAAIGFYHAYRDRNNTNVDNFHRSGRKMHPVPVSMSLVATFLSGLTLLGNPTEIYTNGTMFYWITLAMLIATASSAHVFVPIFYKLNCTSCYEYINRRFGRLSKCIASAVFILQTIVYMGFVLYAPSLAFEAVTGLSLWVTMLSAALVCTLYTTLGGMKTVLWTDTLQLVIMVAGLITVLYRGSEIVGGFGAAWKVAEENNRIEFFNYSMDPRTRHSIWSMVIGGGLFWAYLYGANQSQVQRACSLPSLRKAQLAIWINFPGLVIIITLTCMIGVVMYAFYKDCDPVKFGLIERPDQMLPLMVMDVLTDIPGLTGLFVACVFSGSLSSVSSGLNAMSAVIVEDFVKPMCCKSIHGRRELILSKVLVVAMGILQFFVATLITQGSGIILQLSYSMFSVMSGPLLGVFISGMIFPWTNKYGATAGMLVSLTLVSWLVFGTTVERPSPLRAPLAVSTNGCLGTSINSTLAVTTPAVVNNATSTMSIPHEESLLADFYRMSYMWYTGFGMLVQLITALFVSFMTGHTRPRDVDSELMIPLFYNLMPCLSEKYRRWLKFGVVYCNKDDPKDKMYSAAKEDIQTQFL